MATRTSATVGTVFAALFAAHQVADHWVQTQHQADTKGQPGWPGRLSCAAHVATYTATAAAALAAVHACTGRGLSAHRAAAGLAVSAVTHYVADRRTPLQRLATLTGSLPFHNLGTPRPGHDDNPSLGTGAYALDQSWHVGWLFVAALLAGSPERSSR